MDRFPKKNKCPDYQNRHKSVVYETTRNKFHRLDELAILLQPMFPDNVLHYSDQVCRNCYNRLSSLFVVSSETAISSSDDSASSVSSGELFGSSQEESSQTLDCNKCEQWIASFKTSLENCKTTSEKIRLLTAAPINVCTKQELTSKLNVTNYVVNQARRLLAEKGCYMSPDLHSGHPVPVETIKAAMEYYINDDMNCSRQSANKKDTKNVFENGIAVQKVKRFMTRSVKETYNIFKEEHPELKLSLTKFYSIRPKWVALIPTQQVCLCVYCTNLDLLITAVKNHLPLKESVEVLRNQLLSAVVCSDDYKCIFGDCKKCPGAAAISFALFECTEENEDDEISFAFWEKNDLVTKTTTMDNFIKILADWTLKARPHLKCKEIQQRAIKNEKEMARSSLSHLILHIDFAENWSIILQDEIQGHHWKNDQVSIFTAVCYLGLKTISYALVSDDTEHDSAHALFAMKYIKEDLKTKYTDMELSYETVISDGAAAHFKNRYQFNEMKNSPHVKKWIFSATGHGKGACDGVGGVVKHLATRYNLSTTPINSIQNAQKFVEVVQRHTSNIEVKLLNAEEIQTFRRSMKNKWNNVKAINGIRSSHAWKAEKMDTKVYTARTCDHEWTLAK